MKTVMLAVNGTLMRGLELEPNLLNAGASFVREARTEKAYRLWSIEDRCSLCGCGDLVGAL